MHNNMPIENRNTFFSPHLGVSYIKSYLEHKKIRLDVCDFSDYTHNEFISKFNPNDFKNYKLIGFPAYDENINLVLYTCRNLKEYNKHMNIFLGGPHASNCSKDIMINFEYIDYIVLGEGEQIIYNLIRFLYYKDVDIKKIKGLCYRTKDSIHLSNEFDCIHDLDLIPYPDNRTIKSRPYDENTFKNESALNIISSRGCPYRCNFCGLVNIQKQWRGRSTKNIIDEIIYIEKLRIKNISIYFLLMHYLHLIQIEFLR